MLENKSNISKGELISALTDIDEKINSLYARSNSDFMQLNEYLKDYHRKTKIISENAFRIIEKISGGSDMELIKELKNIHNKTDLYNSCIINEHSNKLGIFNDISNRTNQLYIVLRNLRQDFITLRFLSSNYSLLSTYNESSLKPETGLEVWNSALETLQQSMISLNKQVQTLREISFSVINHVKKKAESSKELFKGLSEETIKIIDTINRKNQESRLQFPDLKEKTIGTSKNISDIITHLQYQDIIRQKIEHIQKSHHGIIEDLSKTGQAPTMNCSQEDYIKISDIIDLQSAQLILVCKEYQNAINVITRNFQKITSDMSRVSEISDNLSFENNNSETTLLRQISARLDNGIIQLDLSNEKVLNQECLQIGKDIKEIIDKLEDDIRPHLESFAGEKRIINILRYNGVGSGVFTQMIALNRDIELKLLDIQECITELKNLINDFVITDKEEIEEDPYEIERLHIMVRISKTLDLLDRDNEELDKFLIQNRQLNSDILQKIETVVDKSDYSEYFENTVGKIISKLSCLNDRIRPAQEEDTHACKAENLEEMKTSYTMESERIIHGMLISGEKENDISELLTNDNDVEFF
jgi:hypothetical protein